MFDPYAKCSIMADRLPRLCSAAVPAQIEKPIAIAIGTRINAKHAERQDIEEAQASPGP